MPERWTRSKPKATLTPLLTQCIPSCGGHGWLDARSGEGVEGRCEVRRGRTENGGAGSYSDGWCGLDGIIALPFGWGNGGTCIAHFIRREWLDVHRTKHEHTEENGWSFANDLPHPRPFWSSAIQLASPSPSPSPSLSVENLVEDRADTKRRSKRSKFWISPLAAVSVCAARCREDRWDRGSTTSSSAKSSPG